MSQLPMDREFRLSGVTLRCTEAGQGPSVLLLHAGGERRTVWDRVIAHGWDLARATGQPFHADEADVVACIEVMGPAADEERPVGTAVPFGRPVAPPPDATPVDCLAAVLGRDPLWTPAQA